jgi:rRNA maturation endonuclease Nob1
MKLPDRDELGRFQKPKSVDYAIECPHCSRTIDGLKYDTCPHCGCDVAFV